MCSIALRGCGTAGANNQSDHRSNGKRLARRRETNLEQLLAKLTNLGYELFGVILPGIVALIFLVMWWVALGPLAPHLSSEFFPQLTSNNASKIVESISIKTGIGIALPGLIVTYFLGHILLWIARSGKASDAILKDPFKRTIQSIYLKIPKPESSFDPKLQPLFDEVCVKFSKDSLPLTWPQFYPLAKSYLARNLTQSLVSNYQNKYTLHRSITLAAAGLFWLVMIGSIIGALALQASGIGPRWWLIVLLGFFSVITVWGFSDSYAYHWKLFGNTIITESYSMIFGPRDEPTKP